MPSPCRGTSMASSSALIHFKKKEEVMKSYTFYSKNSGLQVYCTSTVKRGYRYGRIALRAFPLEEGGREKRIILMLLPEEAFKLSARIRDCLSRKEGASNVIVHKREKDEKEIVSYLHIDRWEKDGKSGWGISISQKQTAAEEENKTRIPVPITFYGMGYLMKLLEAFSVEQAIEDKIMESESEEPAETPGEDDFEPASGEEIPF